MSAKTIFLIVALLSIPVGLFAADDPFVGSWKLNVGKSKYNPGPPPANPSNVTLKFEPTADGGMNVIINGRPRLEKYDGKPHPIEPEPGGPDAVSGKRINSNTMEIENWRMGKVVARLSRIVSKDGKTLTLKAKGTNAQGKPFDDVRVYDRQ